jgi:hypothetical protein
MAARRQQMLHWSQSQRHLKSQPAIDTTAALSLVAPVGEKWLPQQVWKI